MKRQGIERTDDMIVAEKIAGAPLEKYLRREYAEKGRTQKEIAEDLELSQVTVGRWIRNLNIKTRSSKEAHKTRVQRTQEEIEDRIGEPLKKYLKREHLDNQSSQGELAEGLGISRSAVNKWIKHFEIKYDSNKVKWSPDAGKKRPFGYWGNWDNVVKELKTAKKKLGHFPSNEELVKLGIGSLSTSLSYHHDIGLQEARRRIDPKSMKDMPKPKGYWADPDNVRREAKQLIKEFGYLPSKQEVEKKSQASFYSGVLQYGGIYKLREDLGLTGRLPPGHWKDFKKLKGTLEEIIDEISHFPTQDELAERKMGLMSGIAQYHGGLWNVAVKMGHTPKQERRGYWKDWENVETELKKVIKKIRHFPSGPTLRKENPGLLSAIEKNHGGMNEARKRLGVPLGRKEMGYWKNEETVLREAKKFMRQHCYKELPSPNIMSAKGASSLIRGIGKFGGFRKIREELGGTNTRVESGNWQDEKYTLGIARKILREHHLDRLPSTTGLQELGYGSLSSAISSHHGGFYEFRQKLGEKEDEIRTPMGFWNKKSNVVSKLKGVMREHKMKSIPSHTALCKMGESALAAAIVKHGGIKKMRRLFGQAENPYDANKPSKRELQRVYIAETRTLEEVGKRYDVTDYIVRRWLKEYDIPTIASNSRKVPTEYRGAPQAYIGPTKGQLERGYVREGKTIKEIAESLDVSTNTVRKSLQRHEIPLKTRLYLHHPGEDKLRKWYVGKEEPVNSIAGRLGVSTATVRTWLDEAKIPIRDISQSRLGKGVKKPSDKQLRAWYVDQRKTTVWIGERVGVADGTIGNWLADAGIERRDKRGLYDDKATRQRTFKELLRRSGKSPQEINTGDYSNTKREDGTSFSGLIGWYGRKYNVGHSSAALDHALYDLCGIKIGSVERRTPRVERGELKDWRNYKTQLTAMFEDNQKLKGDFPTTNWMNKNGYHALAVSAAFHGGISKVREKLGHAVLRRSSDYLRDPNKINAEIKAVMKKHKSELKGKFPSSGWLQENGYSYLSNAAQRHHQGLSTIRSKLGYEKIKPIKTQSELVDFLQGSEEAKQIGSLAGVAKDASDIAIILAQRWPDRFPSAANLAKSLPGAVKRIGYSLHPFTMEKARGIYEKTKSLPMSLKYALDDLLYTIAVDQYQMPFDQDPQGTREELREFARQKNGIKGLARKVLDYYDEVYSFSIPGHGKLGAA